MNIIKWDEDFKSIVNKISLLEVSVYKDMSQKDLQTFNSYKKLISSVMELEQELSAIESDAQRKDLLKDYNKYFIHWTSLFTEQIRKYIKVFFQGSNKQMWLNLLQCKLFNIDQSSDLKLTDKVINRLLKRVKDIDQNIQEQKQQLGMLEKALKTKDTAVINQYSNETCQSSYLSQFGARTTESLNYDLDHMLNRIAIPFHQSPKIDKLKALNEKYQEKAMDLIESYQRYLEQKPKSSDKKMLLDKKGMRLDNEELYDLSNKFKEIKFIRRQLDNSWQQASRLQIPSPKLKLRVPSRSRR